MRDEDVSQTTQLIKNYLQSSMIMFNLIWLYRRRLKRNCCTILCPEKGNVVRKKITCITLRNSILRGYGIFETCPAWSREAVRVPLQLVREGEPYSNALMTVWKSLRIGAIMTIPLLSHSCSVYWTNSPLHMAPQVGTHLTWKPKCLSSFNRIPLWFYYQHCNL